MGQILLVDDALDSQEIVRRALGPEHGLRAASTLKEAREALAGGVFDLLLLDVMMPDGDGFKFLASARNEGILREARVIFVTGKDAIDDKVVGFTVGADDYLPKPFHPMELKARVGALLKRRKEEFDAQQIVSAGNLRLETDSLRATVLTPAGELLLDLTPLEFRLLAFLARNATRVLSRERLLDAVWTDCTDVYDRTVDAHLSKLRKKLLPSNVTIESLYGVGYRLVEKTAK
jgi:DNA-binding response OmpR family regulator